MTTSSVGQDQPTHRNPRLHGPHGRRAALLATAAAALTGCARPTPKFTDPTGQILPNSIAEEIWLSLPGCNEFLLMRGRDCTAPAILFLHGGPGASETALMRMFQPRLENQAVMAYWDQRGAGRSYHATIPPDTMTINHFIDDMDCVVDHLRSRLAQNRIWLLGHSWGSALGLLYAHRHADKIAGYIGTGQVASNPWDEMHAYDFVLAEARKRDDHNALQDLNDIGPPPYNYDHLPVRDRWLDRFGGYFHKPLDKWRIVFDALVHVPETDIRDLFRLWRGTAFSQQALWPEFARLDLPKQVPDLEVPVTFILGRYDQRTWSPYAADYLRQMQAPVKRLVWLENAAHNAPFEEPEAFHDAVLAALNYTNRPKE